MRPASNYMVQGANIEEKGKNESLLASQFPYDYLWSAIIMEIGSLS